MSGSGPNQVQHDGDNNELPQDGEAWGEGLTDPVDSTRLANTSSPSSDDDDTGKYLSSGLVASSSSSDEDSDPSPSLQPGQKVTRREMIMALIARSEMEEEGQNPETGSVTQDVVERKKKKNHMEYMKHATPIDDLPCDKKGKVRCNLCNKIITKRYIYEHIDGVHSNLRVNCDVCGKEVRRLWQHKNTVHAHNPLVKCDVCGKEVKKHCLKQHKMIHANVGRTKKMPCNICGKLLQKVYLKIHKKNHCKSVT